MKLDLRDTIEKIAIYSPISKFSLLKMMHHDAFLYGQELFPLEIVMPCGCRYNYFTELDFPDCTILCKCGKEEHKVIEYILH